MTSRYNIIYYGLYVRIGETVLALDVGDGSGGQYAALSEARAALTEWWPKYTDASSMWVEKIAMHELYQTRVDRQIGAAKEPVDDRSVNE